MKPIKNHIIFKFKNEVDSEGRFIDASDTIAIVRGDFDASAKDPRWGIVVAAGPDTSADVNVPGTEILIDSLKWTMGFKHDGDTYWRTDENCVLAVAE